MKQKQQLTVCSQNSSKAFKAGSASILHLEFFPNTKRTLGCACLRLVFYHSFASVCGYTYVMGSSGIGNPGVSWCGMEIISGGMISSCLHQLYLIWEAEEDERWAKRASTSSLCLRQLTFLQSNNLPSAQMQSHQMQLSPGGVTFPGVCVWHPCSVFGCPKLLLSVLINLKKQFRVVKEECQAEQYEGHGVKTPHLV